MAALKLHKNHYRCLEIEIVSELEAMFNFIE